MLQQSTQSYAFRLIIRVEEGPRLPTPYIQDQYTQFQFIDKGHYGFISIIVDSSIDGGNEFNDDALLLSGCMVNEENISSSSLSLPIWKILWDKILSNDDNDNQESCFNILINGDLETKDTFTFIDVTVKSIEDVLSYLSQWKVNTTKAEREGVIIHGLENLFFYASQYLCNFYSCNFYSIENLENSTYEAEEIVLGNLKKIYEKEIEKFSAVEDCYKYYNDEISLSKKSIVDMNMFSKGHRSPSCPPIQLQRRCLTRSSCNLDFLSHNESDESISICIC